MAFDNTTLDPATFAFKAGKAASLLRAMSNEHRLMILCRLNVGEANVGELRTNTSLSQSALSQHLAVLRDDDLVSTRREGQTIYYSLGDPAVARIIEALVSIYCPELM
jgi:DNA-binding transcriptional ArsR family regulator